MRAQALQKLVIALAVLVDIVRKVKQRLREPAALGSPRIARAPARTGISLTGGGT